MELSESQFHRYARHLILDEVGEEGQAKLLAARVLVVGAGGLGSPLLLYLAAAGVGTLGVIDHDRVDLTNLQRQIVHATRSVGTLKVESARATLAAVNDGIRIETHPMRLGPDNAAELIAGYDLVADGSDNFATRYLLTEQCFRLKRPLVAAALSPFEGQLSTFRPYLGAGHPCYRCLFREPPPPGLVPRCEEAGILGAVAGVMGTLQAVEVLKEILGLGDSLDGTLLIYDALRAHFHRIRIDTHPVRLGPDNAEAIVAQYDIVADGSDNFATRYLLNDLCYRLKKPLIAAALSPFEGQLSTFRPYIGAGHPCYRCLFREPPPPDMVPRCEEAGILGAVAGVLGTLQAVEVLKEVLGLGDSLDGTLLIYDALHAGFHRIRIAKDPECPTCGAGAHAAAA